MNSQAILYPPGANDECHTPDYAVKALIAHMVLVAPDRLRKHIRIWCPFDTQDSQFVIQLEQAGYQVWASHISAGQDFYTYEPPVEWDAIVSNPPFTNKAKIFERCISFGKPFALLMSLTWLNDSAPKKIFGDSLELLMFQERVKYLGQESKITFSSAFFGVGVFPKPIQCDSLKKYGMK